MLRDSQPDIDGSITRPTYPRTMLTQHPPPPQDESSFPIRKIIEYRYVMWVFWLANTPRSPNV